MPLLATWLGLLVTWLVENFFIGMAAWFTKRTLATLALYTVLSAAIVAFFAAVKLLIAGLGAVMPAALGTAITWVLPSNVPYVITFYFSVRAAGSVFRYTRQIITGATRGAGGDSKAIWG